MPHERVSLQITVAVIFHRTFSKKSSTNKYNQEDKSINCTVGKNWYV